MATKVKHPDRLGEQVNNILTNRDSWDQELYHSACGTKHCIAGHGQIAAGKPMNVNTCRDDAQEWYGITDEDAQWLFYGDRTLPEMHGFASAALAGDLYFDADGFGRNGYHRDGFNRDGYDRRGYDLHGFSRDGFNRDGFNIVGHNREGYNRHGIDRNGDSLPLLNIAAGDTQ